MNHDHETDKKTVPEFYDFLINKKDSNSAGKYMGNRYEQHNSLVADDPEGLRTFCDFLRKDLPEAHGEIKRVFVDGDRTILHVHSTRIPGTRGRAIIETFRPENGKVDEHRDVIRETPETSADHNGTFRPTDYAGSDSKTE